MEYGRFVQQMKEKALLLTTEKIKFINLGQMKFATHQLGRTEMDPFQPCVGMALK